MPSLPAREMLALLLRPEIEETTDEVLHCLLGEDFEAPRPDPPADGPLAWLAGCTYDDVLDHLERFVRTTQGELARQAESAAHVWSEIERQPPARRLLLVRHRRQLHSWGLFNLLLESSRRLAAEDPPEACHRAELALELAARIPRPWLSGSNVEDLRASALRHLARAQHLARDLAAAERTLGEAWRAVQRGTGDLLERAHLMCLDARLAAERGESEQAARLLGPAKAIFQRLHETALEGQTLIEHAELVGHRDPTLGSGLLRDALELVDPDRDPRAAIALRHLLGWFVNDLDRPFESREILDEARALALGFPDAAIACERRWLKGRILRNLDSIDDAESALVSTLRALGELGAVENFVLCGLDLLELYTHAGRAADADHHGRAVLDRLEEWGLGEPAVAVWHEALAVAADRPAVQALALRIREGRPRLFAVARLHPGR